MAVVREGELREGRKPSTILQNTTRLSRVILRRDERPITFYFQRVWAFLTSFQTLSLPVGFVRFSGLLFSVCAVFSVLLDLARIDHRFGNEGDFGRPERFSESFAIDPVQVE